MGTPSSMTIRWRTNIATSTRVWYGLSPSNLAFTNTVNGTRTEHEVKVSGLAANTTYYYAVGNTSGQLMTPTANHYFRTSPTPGSSQTVKVWVLGDCGTGDDNQRDVRDAFYNYFGPGRLDMMLLLGDNAYEDGTDAEFQVALFENMYEGRIINTVMWPAIGNHETITADSPTQTGPYYDIFTMPTNGEAGGTPSGTEAYYSFDYGNIHFIVLDSDDSNRSPSGPMLTWLQNDLANTTQDWKVAYFHHPPYSKNGSSDNATKETQMRQNALPILEAHGVDLVLVGHSHDYERSYLINGHYGYSSSWNPATMALDLGDGRLDGDGAYTKSIGAGPAAAGTVYIVTGSAAKKGGGIITPHPVMYKSLDERGSLYFEVTGNQMDITFIRQNEVIEDYLTIIKSGITGSPPSVSITAPSNGSNYTSPQAINIQASAFDSDGSVTEVRFFVNGVSIGVDNQAPYSINYALPANGTYNIMAVAEDNHNNTTQSSIVLVTVGPVTTCSRVAAGSDDAEQRASGSTNLTSGDIELVEDPGLGNQVIGLRFNNLNIPQGATIMSAYLQFTADENVNDNPCNLTIYGHASDNANTFASTSGNISGRPRTNASVVWSPSDWLSVGAAGLAQKTIDISYVIQEIVSRPGFTENSSIALIIEGTGRRVAEAFEGSATKAPELCIQYGLNLPDCPGIPANIGAPCNDGDNTTINDMINASCNCVGTPTACTGIGDSDGDGVCANVDCDDFDPNTNYRPGDPCDDGNLATINDTYNSSCDCVGVLNTCPGIGDADGDGICDNVDCARNDPNNPSVAGDPCDDGDNTTINDTYNSNCNCVGTPTACTGIGDNDGDGVCANVDCDDNNPFITHRPGDACDDGDPTTVNDVYGANCNCAGTLNTCPGIGDNDGDGLCSNVDCDDNNPNSISQAGDPCDDGDNTTINDIYDANCNCTGTPTACTGIGDNDGDGVCDDTDCNDFNPNITTQPGDACDDGNPATIGETIQPNCSCGGGSAGSAFTCVRVNFGSDDAEQRASGPVDLVSGDLELVDDNNRGLQTIGLRFNGLNIPQGATITNAYIQFIADENRNLSPCELSISGQASDNPLTFSATNNNVSSRPRTAATVQWLPQEWLSIGDAGLAQRTPNLSAVIQEIVNRGGYTSASSIVLIIEGTGARVAEAFEGGANKAPQLCVAFSDTPLDCPNLSANIGAPCNDGDPTTINDRVNANCNCVGTPTACTGIGDADGDGVCANVDCNDNNPNITTQPGSACDDGNPATVNDALDANCNCAGTLNTCPGIGDNDGDGICADVDCNDNNPAITTQAGDACNDGNPNTFGETIQADCSCGGGNSAPVSACAIIAASTDDVEQESATGRMDLNSSDLELCTDGTSQLVGLRFNNLNIPQGASIVNAYIQFEVDETGNDDPCNLTIYGQASDNAATFTSANFNASSRPRTAGSVAWAPPHWLAVGNEGDAQKTPNLAALIQEIVNRSGYTSASSIAFIIEGTGRRVAESFDGPAGGPQLCVDYFSTPPDYDCPALFANIGAACNDGDNTTINDRINANCNCVGTPTACTGIGDADGDGVCANVDCNDNNPNITTRPGDACDDGNPATVNDVLNANCNCAGTLNTCPGIGDNDGDGICADVDCNDNNPSITTQAGDACDDGNPNTVGETIQADCSCGGGNSTPTLSCSRVSASSDDAEEQAGPADLTSSDLELALDPNLGLQTIGMRFNNLNIPQGAVITNAYIQFTVDETVNDDPCNLTIYGEAHDNAPTFASITNNIKSRARTAATASWSPPAWLTVNAAGPEQKTPDISAVIQEIVSRSGYTSASSIVLIIDGTGRRTAESANGPQGTAPELCVQYLHAGNAMQRTAPSTPDASVENRSMEQGNGGLPLDGISPISVHPNPAIDKLLVTFASAAGGQAQLQARSLNGSVVLSDVREIDPGKNAITLEKLSLPSGIYFLQVFAGGAVQSAKFVIQRD